MGSIRVIRWIIVALSAALSVALIARGNVILGVIIGALALARATLLLRLQSQRRRLSQHFNATRGLDRLTNGPGTDVIGEGASRFF